MATSRSSRVTRSSVGLNGLDENFCGRTLRNRSIAQPEEGQSSPLPGSRAPRSPKKRQDSQVGGQAQQASEKPGSHPGKVADHKPSTDGETWTCPRSPRKRGLSCSDVAGGGLEKTENCEGKGKTGAGREASPLLKRAKRSQVSADEPLPAPLQVASLCSASATKVNSERGDPLRHKFTVSSSCSSLSPNLNSEVGEEEDVNDYVQCDGHADQPLNSNSHNPLTQSPNSNSHKSLNGVGQMCSSSVEEAGMDNLVLEPTGAANTTCPGLDPALLNGNQTTVSPCPSTPDPIVPSQNSDTGQGEESGVEFGVELAVEQGEEQECLTPPLVSFEEDSSTPHLSVREEEVEEEVLDVVGEEVCREEEVTATEEDEEDSGVPGGNGLDSVATSINNIINSVNSLSGESVPRLAPTILSNPASEPVGTPSPPSFTEPYEHRYTLRTSPRRAVCSGVQSGASPKPCSPSREPPLDNGPLREVGETGRGALESACRRLDLDPTTAAPAPSSGRDGPSCALFTGTCLPCPPSAPTESCEDSDMGGGGDLREVTVGLAGKEVLEGGNRPDEEDEEEEEPDVYYFESDHLTLKHNKDYQRLLQTIGVLEAQRTQAILDLEQLARQQREALQDPITFVEQLQKQVELGLPRPQRVVQLPGISWDQYTSGLGDFEREFCDKKRKTRRLQLIFDKVGLPAGPKSPVEPKEEGESSTLYSALPSSDAPENNSSQMIRGRLCHQNKPDTFNQLWTVEEQKKLEQLLLKFPPEEVESKRWQKIADALGNRTAKQVASRVQKYFIKLTKAGIPVPGRTPNMCMYSKKVSNKRQHHLNKHLYRPSTFLTSYEPPVYMEEEDDRAAYYLQDPNGDDSDEDGVPVELRHLPEYQELLELKRMKKHKLQEIQLESSMTLHHGYKCDVCGVDPIQGVRWHCQDCPSDNAVDFCSNCSDCLYQTERHHPTHRLDPIYQHDTFLDKDYCLAQTPGYNYLDPNYYPANR